jgi:hypothetical protein
MISRRRFTVAAVTGLLVLLPASAQDYSVAFPTGEFNVLDGVPCVLHSVDRGPPGNALDIKGSSLVHYGSGKPLAYPLDGSGAPVVTLGKSDGVGTSWDLSGIKGKRGPIRAAEGKYAGWYLDWSESEKEIDYKGKALHTRQLILVENPKEPCQFSRYEVSK